MSARIRSMKSLKSNIIKSKNTKMFAKTVTSNFMKSQKSILSKEIKTIS